MEIYNEIKEEGINVDYLINNAVTVIFVSFNSCAIALLKDKT
jgi:short-subunit dehydrogenase